MKKQTRLRVCFLFGLSQCLWIHNTRPIIPRAAGQLTTGLIGKRRTAGWIRPAGVVGVWPDYDWCDGSNRRRRCGSERCYRERLYDRAHTTEIAWWVRPHIEADFV